MSRNNEKNDSELHRYYKQKVVDAGGLVIDPSARPRKVQSVQRLPEAEAWRKTIVAEISSRLSDINNPSLDEEELRSLNGSLNKLHREKRAWEHHIVSLGGNNHLQYGNNVGLRVNGTVFYGRAKELPEARGEKKPEGEKNGKEAETDFGLRYYGVYDRADWGEPIDASVSRIQAELNDALENNGDSKNRFDSRDVERWMVERRKRELLRQIANT